MKQGDLDKEYPGHEPDIKAILIQLYKKSQTSLPEIEFAEITKRSTAHKAAIEAFRGKTKVDIIVGAKEVINLFYK